ncbi:MAG TPA: endonuclease/exonuclease/phosphatase family protein [Stenotrophomonas sp.]|jgi:endonuclease/exonuclease/phosphatase family metal-dependent hydrolase
MSPPLRHLVRWTWLPALLLAGWAHASPPSLALTGPDGDLLTVATFSLAPDRAHWSAHREGIVEALRALQPDVIALQDVEQTPETPNQACWLAARLDYGCNFISADPPSRSRRYGNALLSRRAVVSDAVTLLHPFETANTAGMIRVELAGLPVNLYVTQLHGGGASGTDDALIRAQQVINLQRWIAVTDDGLPSLLLGDFAAVAGARGLGALGEDYLDAQADAQMRGAGPELVLPEVEGAVGAGAGADAGADAAAGAAAIGAAGVSHHDRILLRKGCFRLARVAALQLPGDAGVQSRGLVATIQVLRVVGAP